MNKRFSQKVKKVLSNSREEALRLGHDYIGTEHILLGMIAEKDTVAISVLKSLKIDLNLLKERIEEAIPVKKGEEAAFPKS
jgi:ATP-dependent Clp protease ATP-binding subunit ClpC